MALLEQPIDLKTGLPKLDVSTMQGANTVKLPDTNVADPYAGFSANALTYVNAANSIPEVQSGQIYQQLDSRFGVQDKAAEARNLKAQIEANAAQAEAARATLESQASGRDVTSTFLGRQQQEISRQETIRNAPLLAQYQAAQGDYQAAQDTVTKLYTAQLADETNKYNRRQDAIKVLYSAANESEKAQLDAKAKQAEQEFTTKQNDIKFEQQKQLAAYEAELKGVTPAKRDTSWQDIDGKRVLVDNQTGEVIGKGAGLSGADLEFAQERGADKIEQLINLADDNVGLSASAGLKRVSINPLNWNRVNDWRKEVANVVARLTVDELGRVKADGVTFGALSDSERKAVGDAASVLSSGAEQIKDEKTGVIKLSGKFEMSEGKVKEALNTIKKYAEIDFERRTGQKYSDFKAKAKIEADELDEINKLMGVNSSIETFSPSKFY